MNHLSVKVTFVCLMTAIAPFLCAQQTNPAQSAATPRLEPLADVPPPPSFRGEDGLEPQVVIRQDGENKIEEFRVNGKLYAIRVTPKIGLPYLLVDQEGHGTMNKMDEIAGGLRPPQWVLIEF